MTLIGFSILHIKTNRHTERELLHAGYPLPDSNLLVVGIRTGDYHFCCPSACFCLISFCSYTLQAFKRSVSAYMTTAKAITIRIESNCLTHTSRVTTFAGSSEILSPQSTLICLRVNVKVLDFIRILKKKKVGSDN